MSRDRLLAGEVPWIDWIQVLPSAIADRVGTDRHLSAPAYRVERLVDGAVLLAVDCGVTIDDPYEHSTEEVSAHLGIPWEQ